MKLLVVVCIHWKDRVRCLDHMEHGHVLSTRGLTWDLKTRITRLVEIWSYVSIVFELTDSGIYSHIGTNTTVYYLSINRYEHEFIEHARILDLTVFHLTDFFEIPKREGPSRKKKGSEKNPWHSSSSIGNFTNPRFNGNPRRIQCGKKYTNMGKFRMGV